MRAAPPVWPQHPATPRRKNPAVLAQEEPAGSEVREADAAYWTVMTSANTTLGPVPAVPDPVMPPASAT